MQYWVSRDSKNFGPYTREQLVEWHAAGNIAANDLVHDGTAWTTIEKFLGLQASPTQGPPPPPPITASPRVPTSFTSAQLGPGGAATLQADTYDRSFGAKNSEGIGLMLVLLPLGAALVDWFYVGSMNLLQNPSSTLSLITILVVLISAVLIAVEANSLGFGNGKAQDGKKDSSPIIWAIFTIFIWIVAVPYYCYRRSRYNRKNLTLASLATVLIFLVTIIGMNYAIEQQRDKVLKSFDDFSSSLDKYR